MGLPPGFSVGDMIALGVVSFNALGFFRGMWKDRSSEDVEQDEKIIQLTSDFLVHKREDELQFKYLREGVERIERRLENLQSQMKYLSKDYFEQRKIKEEGHE